MRKLILYGVCVCEMIHSLHSKLNKLRRKASEHLQKLKREKTEKETQHKMVRSVLIIKGNKYCDEVLWKEDS